MGFRWLLDAPTPISYLYLYAASGDALIFSTYKAFFELFPDVNIEGCFFHLCKRSDFKVKQLGLANKYRSDAYFKICIKKLAALAFIPLKMLCQFTKSWQIELRTMRYPCSHTLKAHGLGTSIADGDATLHLTFNLSCGIWLEALTENNHAHISTGDMKQPSAKEASRNARITIIVQSYISSDPNKIIRGIAVNYMQFCIILCIKLNVNFKFISLLMK